jgi:hypothetical protein
LAIPSLIIGYANEDASCQKEDSTGLTLSDWLIGRGWSEVITLVLALIGGCIVMCTDSEDAFMLTGGVGGCLGLIYGLFHVIYFIIGVVVLARSGGDCVSEGNDLAIMTIIDLILFVL